MRHYGFDRVGREIPVERAVKGCFDKKTFDGRNQARDYAARNAKKFHETPKLPYHCHVCGRWHLTTLAKDGQAVARRRNWNQSKPKKGG